jgi:hypothetical protein
MINKEISSEGVAIPGKWLPRSFHAPEGRRNGQIDDIRRFTQGNKEIIRSVWETEFQPGDQFTFMAGKNYYTTKRRSADEALLDDLFHVLGNGVREFQQADGKVDLDRLFGLEAQLTIIHQQSDRYDDPYCKIVSIKPKAVEPVVEQQGYKAQADADLLWELRGYGLN